MPEPDDEDLRVTRDRRGRLALSRPCVRTRLPAQANGTPNGIAVAASSKAGSVTVANSAKTISPKPSEGGDEAPISEKPGERLQTMWGPPEDVRLLELQRNGKSWDYIEGKLDDKGKDVAALKARFAELTQASKGTSEDKKVEGMTQKENENEAKSPGKKNKGQRTRENREGSPTGSEKLSGKSGAPKVSSQKADNEEHAEAELPKKEANEVAIAAKEGYIGKHGRGEVRFLNGVPILYKHSGANAEQLDAETVAMVRKEATKHDRSKWLTIVSRLFDKTGIRMDPEVARVALENA